MVVYACFYEYLDSDGYTDDDEPERFSEYLFKKEEDAKDYCDAATSTYVRYSYRQVEVL